VKARPKANLTQRQLAALIKNEEGHGMSGLYLSDLELSLRHLPRESLLQQFATVLNLDVDLPLLPNASGIVRHRFQRGVRRARNCGLSSVPEDYGREKMPTGENQPFEGARLTLASTLSASIKF
jgi:transcriptional regulator with XRE-family HTH domain